MLAYQGVRPSCAASCLLIVQLVIVILANDGSGAVATKVSCLPSMKRMFCTQSSYKRLSDYLNKETSGSTDLKDDIEAVKKLIDDDDYCGGCSEFDELVIAFGALRESPKDGLCEKPAMRGLRQLAEAMYRENKGSPKKTQDSMRRLNQMIVKLIKKAHSDCPEILAGRWSLMNVINMKLAAATPIYLEQLDRLPRTAFIFEAYQDRDAASDHANLADGLKNIVATDQLMSTGSYDVRRTVVQADRDLDWDKNSLVKYIGKFIRDPCEELIRLAESKSILEPYVDLLISAFIITHGQEAKESFYDDEYAGKQGVFKEALDMSFRLGACLKLKVMDDEHLIKLMMSSNRKALKKSK